MAREPLLASQHCAKLWSLGVAIFVQAPDRCLLRLASQKLGPCARAAGFALVLVSWARGGQLGGRGKGYQVRARAPVGLAEAKEREQCAAQRAWP